MVEYSMLLVSVGDLFDKCCLGTRRGLNAAVGADCFPATPTFLLTVTGRQVQSKIVFLRWGKGFALVPVVPTQAGSEAVILVLYVWVKGDFDE